MILACPIWRIGKLRTGGWLPCFSCLRPYMWLQGPVPSHTRDLAEGCAALNRPAGAHVPMPKPWAWVSSRGKRLKV